MSAAAIRMTGAAMCAAMAVAVIGSVGVARAAPVTLCGPNICYEYDNTQSGITSFGTPSLAGDSLVFLVPQFRAESTDGAGLVQAIDSFVIDRVYALDGLGVAYVGIFEFGDYEITNGDWVSARLDLDITDSSTLEAQSVSNYIQFNGGTTGLQTWDLQSSFNPAANFSGPATDLRMVITDVLEAYTDENGEEAWIQKKIKLSATTVVPLPAAAWLFISALGLAGLRARRRSA